MKLCLLLLCLINLSSALSAVNCEEPSDRYTTKSMVLDQFVFNNGNPNWGDWCLETNTQQENQECIDELNKWDNWLTCTYKKFENSCKEWAEKENYISNPIELKKFINKCVETNYQIDLNTFCKINTNLPNLSFGMNKDVICRETIKSITGSYQMTPGTKLLLTINSQRTYELELSNIYLSINNKLIFNGSGVLKWNPDGEEVNLN